MTTNLNNDFSDIVFGRKSVRAYDPTIKIPKEEMLTILDEAAAAPSSVNLQPWRFVVVESDEGKAKLKPLIRFNTTQNDTSAAMILIFGDMACHEYTEEIYDMAVAEGKMPADVRDRQVEVVVPYYSAFSREKMNDVVKIDASLAAMQLMLVARRHGYETSPIGGFEEDQVAEAFGLDPERFVPVMIVAIGKAVESGHDSIRLSAERITEFK